MGLLSGGGVVIREASAMSVFPKTEVVSQVESPNIDFANFENIEVFKDGKKFDKYSFLSN